MRQIKLWVMASALSLAIEGALGTETPVPLYPLDAVRLAQARQRIQTNDPALKPIYDALLQEANQALGTKPFSVMDKTRTPPSGDKHDYSSIGPYVWPNPKTPDGLPYISRDGQINPESRSEAYDAERMQRMSSTVRMLTLAHALTGEEKYAAKAVKLLQVWYLDPATRMNPNLTWSQVNPGHARVTGTGIINSVSLVEMPNAITLLANSKSLAPADLQRLKVWFESYLDWLLTSEKGKLEGDAKNNHGVWYDAQVAAFALFVGRPEVARQVAESAKARRIALQIQPDGSQPLELRRTRSLHYSVYNLNAFSSLARAGERVGVDLWHYETPDGRSIRKALDYVLQYANPDKKWPAQEIKGYNMEVFYPVMLCAGADYHDEALIQAARKIGSERNQLLRLMLNQ